MDSNNGNSALKQQKIDTKISTIVAKAVNVHKHENNELIHMGKLGFALAGDVKLDYYQLLLYGKNSVIINLVITKDFEYKINENNTVEFLFKDKWHLEFANTNDAILFNTHLTFVLWKLNGCKELFWSDLYYPPRDDKVATVGSIVEITFAAHVIQNKRFGPEVSNNIGESRFLKVNVGEKGWEKSLVGVNEKTQRILFIPNTETGAWKILTDGRQCMMLSVTIQSVDKITEDDITDSQAIITQEIFDSNSNYNSSTVNQSKETVHDVSVAPLKKINIETLYEEFENFKLDYSKTNERLTKLEALIVKNRRERVENSNELELKKCLKNIYRSIAKEFPVDETFSGDEIQTKIREIFAISVNQF